MLFTPRIKTRLLLSYKILSMKLLDQVSLTVALFLILKPGGQVSLLPIPEFPSLRSRPKKSLLSEDIEACRVARNTYFHAMYRTRTKNWESFLAEAKDKAVFTAFSYSRPDGAQCSLITSLKYKTQSGVECLATTYEEKCQEFVSNHFPVQSDSPSLLEEVPCISPCLSHFHLLLPGTRP